MTDENNTPENTTAANDPQWEALEKEAVGLDMTPEDAAAQQEAQAEEQKEAEAAEVDAQMLAHITTGTAAGLVNAVWPFVSFDDETKQRAAENLAPLFKKYGLTASGAGRWVEEINAAIFFGTLAMTTYSQIQHHKAEQQQKEQAANGEQSEYRAA